MHCATTSARERYGGSKAWCSRRPCLCCCAPREHCPPGSRKDANLSPVNWFGFTVANEAAAAKPPEVHHLFCLAQTNSKGVRNPDLCRDQRRRSRMLVAANNRPLISAQPKGLKTDRTGLLINNSRPASPESGARERNEDRSLRIVKALPYRLPFMNMPGT